jgi:hypothetical protein
MFSLSIISSFKILDLQSWRDIEPETRLISRIASLGPDRWNKPGFFDESKCDRSSGG